MHSACLLHEAEPSPTGDLPMYSAYIPHEATGTMACCDNHRILHSHMYHIPHTVCILKHSMGDYTAHSALLYRGSTCLQKDKDSPPLDFWRTHRADAISGMLT